MDKTIGWDTNSLGHLSNLLEAACVLCLLFKHVGSFWGPRQWHWKVDQLLSGARPSP